MSNYNLVLLIVISSNLLLLQGSLALVNDIHERNTTEAREKGKLTTVLASAGCGCNDQDCVGEIWRRRKRKDDDHVKPDNSVNPYGGSVKPNVRESTPNDAVRPDGGSKKTKDVSPKSNDSAKTNNDSPHTNDNTVESVKDSMIPVDNLTQSVKDSVKPVDSSPYPADTSIISADTSVISAVTSANSADNDDDDDEDWRTDDEDIVIERVTRAAPGQFPSIAKKPTTTHWNVIKKHLQVYDSNTCRQVSKNVNDTVLYRTVCADSTGATNNTTVCRGGSTVLFCDGVVSGFLQQGKHLRCNSVHQITVFTDLGSYANWTRNFAPKSKYNGLMKIKTEEIGERTDIDRYNQSNIVHAIVFLLFPSAIAVFILS